MARKRTFSTMVHRDNHSITVQYRVQAPSLYKRKGSVNRFGFTLDKSYGLSLATNPKPCKRRKLYSTTKWSNPSKSSEYGFPREETPVSLYRVPILHHCQLIERYKYTMRNPSYPTNTDCKPNRPIVDILSILNQHPDCPRSKSDKLSTLSKVTKATKVTKLSVFDHKEDDLPILSCSSEVVSNPLNAVNGFSSESDNESIGSWYSQSSNQSETTQSTQNSQISQSSGYSTDRAEYNDIPTNRHCIPSRSYVDSVPINLDGNQTINYNQFNSNYPSTGSTLAPKYNDTNPIVPVVPVTREPCNAYIREPAQDLTENHFGKWLKLSIFVVTIYLGIRYGKVQDLVGSGVDWLCKDSSYYTRNPVVSVERGQKYTDSIDWLTIAGVILVVAIVWYIVRDGNGNRKEDKAHGHGLKLRNYR